MSIFKYKDSQLIDEVAFSKTANGAVRAYVHASGSASNESIGAMLDALKAHDYECVPFTLNGKSVLEVRGFNRESEFITFIDKQKWITDKPEIIKEPGDEPGWKEILQKRSMQASGAAMMVADIGFAMYGAQEKNWKDTLAGLSYLAGSATLLTYGRNDQSQLQVRQLAQMMVDHAREKGLQGIDDSAAATIGKERKDSALRKLDNIFRKNPSEIGNMCYVAAGGLIGWSALQHKALATPDKTMTAEQIKKMRIGGWGDTALGTVTIGSGLTATFVKEKAHDPDAPKKHGLAAVAEWIRESPLRAASYGYVFSTMCHALTTYVERKEAKRMIANPLAPAVEIAKAHEKIKAIPWRVMFVSMTLVGEFLLSISSKGHGEGVVSDNSVDNSAVAIMADLIVKQPAHMQDQLIEDMGKYLGRPEVLAIKDTEATNLLRQQVECMRKNPWAQVEHAVDKPVPAVPLPASASTVNVPKADMPKWQAKVAATPDNTGAQMQPSS